MRVRNRNETVISHCGAEEGSLQRRPKLKTSKLTFFRGEKMALALVCAECGAMVNGGPTWQGHHGVMVWAVQLALLKKN